MRMPRERRRNLAIIAGTLFAINVFALVFSISYVVGPSLPVSDAQYAGAKLASTDAKETPKPDTETCNLGEVHTVKGTGEAKDRTKVSCFLPAGSTTINRSSVSDGACKHADAKKCLVRYCPGSVLKSGKEEGCVFVCRGENDKECLSGFLSRLKTQGSKVLLEELKKEPALGITSLNGAEQGQLASALKSETVQQWRSEVTDDQTKKFLNTLAEVSDKEDGCLKNAQGCLAPVYPQLNKDIAAEQVRLNADCSKNPAACQRGPGNTNQNPNQRDTMTLPGGRGLPPPPLIPPKTPQPPQTFQCTDIPRPSAECTSGEWQPQRGSQCIIGWLCTATSTSGGGGSVGTPPDPKMALIANPSSVASGGKATIGWVTTGMKSCTISSPDNSEFTSDNAGNTSKSGTARTPELDSTTDFVLTCTTLGDATVTKEVTVGVSSADAREGQLASALLATAHTAMPPKPDTYQCNPGHVQAITQTKKDSPPKVDTSRCYVKDPRTGQMTLDPGARTRPFCVFSSKEKANKCVVVFCPPTGMFVANKKGSCIEVNCGAEEGSQCLRNTVINLGRTSGTDFTLAKILKADEGKTAAVTLTQGGVNGNDFLIQALNPEAQKSVAGQVGEIDPSDKVYKLINEGKPPCSGDGCATNFKPNADLPTQAVRVNQQPPPVNQQQPPPTNQQGPPQSQSTFPNIHKKASGTDVLAWVRHLMGANQPEDQKQQQPACVDLPQPPLSQCTSGTWESIKSGTCVSAWKCVQTRIVSFKSVPESTTSGTTVNLAWVTENMKECVISSPDFSDFTEANKDKKNPNGAVTSPTLTGTSLFELTCVSQTNATSTRTLTVGVLP